MIGTAPPPALADRPAIAAWYAEQVDAAAAEHPDDPTGGPAVQDLITGAIAAGVVGIEIPVPGFALPQPLHQLFAPYRRRPNGLTAQQDAARRHALKLPLPTWWKP